jgi:hypothetical protein
MCMYIYIIYAHIYTYIYIIYVIQYNTIKDDTLQGRTARAGWQSILKS